MKEPAKPAAVAAIAPPPAEKPVEPIVPDEEEDEAGDAPFIEPNPTIINPAASRVGLTSAAKAADKR